MGRSRVLLFRLLTVSLAIVGSFLIAAGLAAQQYVNAQLPWHEAVLDSQGRLLAWYHPEKNLGYDQFVRLAWDFIEHKVPLQGSTGLKVYLVNCCYDPQTLQGIEYQHNPACTFAHFVDFLVGWFPYSGDDQAVRVVREMLDYQLAHGTTPPDWDWASVPFATTCPGALEYGRCITGMPPDFYGGIETDKIGELGLGYVRFYEMTGERKYLEAGIHCATALAKHVRAGDAEHTPWPYRVDARTGVVLVNEQYGGMIVAPVRLFDELVRLGVGDSVAYGKARDMAWKWLLAQPLNKDSSAWDKWSGYYEDVPKNTVNVNDTTSMMTAHYILSQDDPSEVEPNWRAKVGHLLDRSRLLLGRGPFFGAWAIDEQIPYEPGVLLGTDSKGTCCSRGGLTCRTAQWGAINAMYYEKARDGQAREDAFRSLNYATYFAASDGKISCCGFGGIPGPYLFEDGYADAGRSFMWALGAIPEFAPVGQDHLLRSSSTVQKVTYGKRSVEYRTFDKVGTEVLRLSFKPTRLMVGGGLLTARSDLREEGYTVRVMAGGDFEVRVRRVKSNDISISGS